MIVQNIFLYSQHVADDADTPHVSAKRDSFVLYHFRCHELWSTKEYSEILLWVVLSRQTEIYYLDPVASTS